MEAIAAEDEQRNAASSRYNHNKSMKEKIDMLQKRLEDGRGQPRQFRASARTTAKVWRSRKRRNAEEERRAQEEPLA
eukprot:14123206-Heterocapsa_arctica.AAC.1